MGVEAACSNSNAGTGTSPGNSRCTSLRSQSGRFYANTIRACMTKSLVLLPSPSHIYFKPSSSAAEHIPDTEACKHWLCLCQVTFWQIGSLSRDYALMVLMSEVNLIPECRDRQSVLSQKIAGGADTVTSEHWDISLRVQFCWNFKVLMWLLWSW